MSDLITRDQVTILVRKIFNRTISTNHAPVPYVSWVGADVNTLRRDWAAAPAVDIPGLAAADIDNSVSSLKEIADVFLDRQPRGTRVGVLHYKKCIIGCVVQGNLQNVTELQHSTRTQMP